MLHKVGVKKGLKVAQVVAFSVLISPALPLRGVPPGASHQCSKWNQPWWEWRRKWHQQTKAIPSRGEIGLHLLEKIKVSKQICTELILCCVSSAKALQSLLEKFEIFHLVTHWKGRSYISYHSDLLSTWIFYCLCNLTVKYSSFLGGFLPILNHPCVLNVFCNTEDELLSKWTVCLVNRRHFCSSFSSLVTTQSTLHCCLHLPSHTHIHRRTSQDLIMIFMHNHTPNTWPRELCGDWCYPIFNPHSRTCYMDRQWMTHPRDWIYTICCSTCSSGQRLF